MTKFHIVGNFQTRQGRLSDTANKRSFTQRLALAVVPRVAWAFNAFACATSRKVHVCEDGAEPVSREQTGIYCFWHRCIMPFARLLGPVHSAVMISNSADGDIAGRFAEHNGFLVIRGSSSRDGLRALLEMRTRVLAGYKACFTPDGPRGPLYKAQFGPLKLAEITGEPIRSFYALPLNAWVLKTWDGFFIPKPFQRIVVAWSTPIFVPKGCTGAELEAKRQEFQDSLDRARHTAEAYHG